LIDYLHVMLASSFNCCGTRYTRKGNLECVYDTGADWRNCSSWKTQYYDV